MRKYRRPAIFLLIASVAVCWAPAQEMTTEVLDLNPFHVYAGSLPTEGAPATQLGERMAREVRVDLQSRGGERYQTDISIRGGIFEGTGLMVGGLALFDPQTGHYFSEIPLDPGFFSSARLLTGVANGIHGFNSTAGSIDWQWRPIRAGGSAYLRAGSEAYIGGGLRSAWSGNRLRYEVGITHEEGDGSIEFGDFDLSRISARMEMDMGGSILRIFGGYLDKFYGWPGMYTGFALNETDDYAVSLLGWQWESNPGASTRHRIGGYWREVDDDYEYLRSSPNAFFEHKTEVISLQGDGVLSSGELELVYRWAMASDRIIRSTSLVNGDFDQRDYGEAALLAKRHLEAAWGEWIFYGGAALQTSNEDSTTVTPQLGVRASGISDGTAWNAYLEYAASSQVPGYTALNSAPSGLFGGNKDLGRERAAAVEGGYSFQGPTFSAKAVAFFRRDSNLVDWVYESDTPTARQAAPVDIDVAGLEFWLGWDIGPGTLEAGYLWLDKDADYRSDSYDASFYALNYARHRLLVTWQQSLGKAIGYRLESEFRQHPDNALRSGGTEAMLVHAEITWKHIFGKDVHLVLRGNNLFKESFQMLPGTPGPGRELILTLCREW